MAATKPRILCLHGKCQSGAIFSNKISGARRKLSRQFDLDFLDAPFVVEAVRDGNDDVTQKEESSSQQQLAWWLSSKRDQVGRQNHHQQEPEIKAAFRYVLDHCQKQQPPYDAILGFSQGGLLATALSVSGELPSSVKAIVTAGSPCMPDVLQTTTTTSSSAMQAAGQEIPKLHFAGQLDDMIPVESVQSLSDSGGNGEVMIHDKGHLFPTKALYVNHMVDFLSRHLLSSPQPKEH